MTSSKEELPWRQGPICYTIQQLATTQQGFVLNTLCSSIFCQTFLFSTSLLFYQNFLYPPTIKQTSVLPFYCSTLLLFYPSIVLPFYCSIFLLFYPSLVLLFLCSIFLIFHPPIVIFAYILLLFCPFIVLTFYYSTLLLFNYPTAPNKQIFVLNIYCAYILWSGVSPYFWIQLKQRTGTNKNKDMIQLNHVILSQEYQRAQKQVLKNHAFHAL